MAANELVKKNISGMQVIKTLQLLLEGNYTMSELVSKLNETEKDSIFNNSVVSKYINTCRHCGIEIHKIHNQYFVAKMPFGLDFTSRELELLNQLQTFSQKYFSTKFNKNFDGFIAALNKLSNRHITRIEKKSYETTFDFFNKAVREGRKVILMFKVKSILECIPVAIVQEGDETFFKIIDNKKERLINIDRVTGIEVSDNFFDKAGQKVYFKLYGALAKRYTLHENEVLETSDLPESITVVNINEDKKKLLSRLLRYDKCCEIMRPQSYRDEMKLTIEKMLANYGE